MKRQVVKMVISQAIVASINTKSNPYFTSLFRRLHPFKSFRRLNSTTARRSITTTSCPDDALDGGGGGGEFPSPGGKYSDEALLISNAISITENAFFTGKTLNLKLNESLVIEVLKLIKNPQICVRFFIWAETQSGYTHTDPTCHALLDILAFHATTNNNYRFPDHFFGRNDDADKQVMGRLFHVFILRCCQNGMWNVALDELHRLKDIGYRPWKSTYDALLLALLNADKLDTALYVLRQMRYLGVSATRFALGCFAKSLSKVGRWEEALDMIEEETERVKSDARIYTQMISGLCEASLFDQALLVLQRMKLNSCVPDVVTYRMLLHSCLRKENLELCKRIVGMMIADGVSTSVLMFESLLKACFGSGDFEYGCELLREMISCGCIPSKTNYNDLLLVLIKAGQVDTALSVRGVMRGSGVHLTRFTLGCFAQSLCKLGRCAEALKMAEEEKVKPDTKIYTQMISGFCEASLFEEAVNLLQKMRSNSCIPDVVTYNTLLHACLRKENLDLCKRILSLMTSDGCWPSFSMIESLVEAYCSSGDYAYAYEFLRKMSGYGGKSDYFFYNTLIGALCKKEELPNTDILGFAEKAYSEMLNAGIVLHKVNVAQFVRCLCGARKFDRAFAIIDEMRSKGDASTYSKVITSFCKASEIGKAFLLFRKMKEQRIIPNVYTYTTLIDSFCKAGSIQVARNLFGEMIKNGCTPNVVTFTALIHGYLKAKMVIDADYLFEKMISAGCSPNVVTYTALIDGLCKAGDVKKGCQIYSRMMGGESAPDVDFYFRSDVNTMLEPNVLTYGALVDGLCKDKRVAEARELLNVMSMVGCDPNHIVYTALIDGFCKIGKLHEVHDLISEMSQGGYSANAHTYSSLIDRLVKDTRIDLALKVLSLMLSNSCPPDVVTYTNIIDGLCKVGKTDEAYTFLVTMEEKGCIPDVVTYTVLIDGFGKVGNVNMSLTVLEQMIVKGCAPDLVTYRVLIKHCCAAGLLDEAHTFLKEMKQIYQLRNAAGYCKSTEGFNKEFLISLGLQDLGSEDCSSPLVPAYRSLIDSFIKAGRLEMALELHTEISTSLDVSALNSNIYCSLIESLSSACEVEKAFELYGDMESRGYIPDIDAFFYLIRGLTKVNKWVEALQLSHCICHMDVHWHPREETSDQV